MSFEDIMDEQLAEKLQAEEMSYVDEDIPESVIKESLSSSKSGEKTDEALTSEEAIAKQIAEDEALARKLEAEFKDEELAEKLQREYSYDPAEPSPYREAIPSLNQGKKSKKKKKGKKTLVETTVFVTKHDPEIVSMKNAEGFDRFLGQQELDGSGTKSGEIEDDDEDYIEIESLPSKAYNMLREQTRRNASEKIERERHGRKAQKAELAKYSSANPIVVDVDSFVPPEKPQEQSEDVLSEEEITLEKENDIVV